jgi:hypothetical protein
MQARRIIEARDCIAQAAYAAMRRVEADAATWRRGYDVGPDDCSRRARTSAASLDLVLPGPNEVG